MNVRCNFARYLILSLLLGLLFPVNSFAQVDEDDSFEVYLAFRHRGVINSIVTSYYLDDVFYLPVNGLFSTLDFEANVNGLVVQGNFGLDQIPYRIDLENYTITFDGTSTEIKPEEVLIKELDYFLHPDIFKNIFGLNFTVDFNNLALDLETDIPIPRIERTVRTAKRENMQRGYRTTTEFFPLEFDRKWSAFDGGFMDYSISAINSQSSTTFNMSNNIGLQLAGGDLQGSTIAAVNSEFSTFATNNLRWRYIIRDTPLITKVAVGDNTLDGALNSQYVGVRLTNEPIESRQFFDEYEVQGYVTPQSEVELYLNNSLIDFQKADDLGRYRFIAPLYYGSSQLDLRIYGPTGQIIQESRRVQVPFNFNPKGEVTYHLNAGRLKNSLIGSEDRNYTVQGKTTVGVTNWLTAGAGFEYFDGLVSNPGPSITSKVSGRLLTNYIVTMEAISNGFFRSGINAIYANSSSFSVNYTNFIAQSGLYNQGGNSSQLSLSGFYPFRIGNFPLNVRASTYTRFRDNENFSNYRLDLNTRVKKMNLRLGYSDRLIDTFNPLEMTRAASVNSSVTYSLTREQKIPDFLVGTFFRGTYRYRPYLKQSESMEMMISKSVLKTGRIQVSLGQNFITQNTNFRIGFIFEFNKARTTTTFTTNSTSYTATQNVRGSVGYDSNYKNFIITSRNQVGKSGTAIRMFVDNNNNHTYDKEEDNLIPEGKMRIGRSGSFPIYKNGVLYYTQMQSYYRYNMEMMKASLNNPMLVPELEKFSLVTDPNSFKKIDIPFYLSGVIEGNVERLYEEGHTQPQGGLNIHIVGTENDFRKDIRTFTDGTFYDYELPPGTYELTVDQSQLNLLGSRTIPEKLDIEVEAKSEGDFIEGLHFLIVPKDYDEEQEALNDTVQTIMASLETDRELVAYRESLLNDLDRSLRLIIMAQNAFYRKRIEQAMDLVNESLDIFKTAQGYALKGSLHYLKGEKELARENWNMAVRFNPDIYIPEMEALDQIINIGGSLE